MDKGTEEQRGGGWGKLIAERGAYTRNYSIVACEMGFAGFAAEDFIRIKVGVVDEPHSRPVVGSGPILGEASRTLE